MYMYILYIYILFWIHLYLISLRWICLRWRAFCIDLTIFDRCWWSERESPKVGLESYDSLPWLSHNICWYLSMYFKSFFSYCNYSWSRSTSHCRRLGWLRDHPSNVLPLDYHPGNNFNHVYTDCLQSYSHWQSLCIFPVGLFWNIEPGWISVRSWTYVKAREALFNPISRLQICPLYIFGNKATDGTYGFKYWFPGFGFDSGPNLQPWIWV